MIFYIKLLLLYQTHPDNGLWELSNNVIFSKDEYPRKRKHNHPPRFSCLEFLTRLFYKIYNLAFFCMIKNIKLPMDNSLLSEQVKNFNATKKIAEERFYRVRKKAES